MDHSIHFKDFGRFILDEHEVQDFIEMFYRWGPAKFTVQTDEKEKVFRGQCHTDMGGHHLITVVRKNIERDFHYKQRIGGNFVAPTLKVAAGAVLAHELQHANQSKLHKFTEGFFQSHRYWNRACERDARQFADEHLAEICAYFGVDAPVRRKGQTIADASQEALSVAGLLSECSQVTMEDIRDELRASKALTPSNVAIVIESLQAQGFDLKRV
jgi:hypothetical protein